MSYRTKLVFVALSGGVDSSVAAALLLERGFAVVGVHMKMWSPSADGKSEARNPKSEMMGAVLDTVCRQQYADRIDAMRVAAHLGIPFQTWDFGEEYRQAVVEYLVREYAAGRTPNPDVMCNREIKFGAFLRRALAAGADSIATGHYIRVDSDKSPGSRDEPCYALCAGRDTNKDQSYFLWALGQDELARCLFPIGEYTKPEVRELARKFGLPTAEKPDSQGVCFIGEFSMADFLKRYIPEQKGRVLTAAGRMLGEHNGAAFYTIGQRQGLGIGGGIPYYVAEKDTGANVLVVAEGPYDEALFSRTLVAENLNWVSGTMPRLPLRCRARIRYRQPLQECLVTSRLGDSNGLGGETDSTLATRHSLRVTFSLPQRAVTPGQSIVFYRHERVLGGGVIGEVAQARRTRHAGTRDH